MTKSASSSLHMIEALNYDCKYKANEEGSDDEDADNNNLVSAISRTANDNRYPHGTNDWDTTALILNNVILSQLEEGHTCVLPTNEGAIKLKSTVDNGYKSEDSVNRESRWNHDKKRTNLSLNVEDYVIYDPIYALESPGTQEQSGHTPPDYNAVHQRRSTPTPSPALEESDTYFGNAQDGTDNVGLIKVGVDVECEGNGGEAWLLPTETEKDVGEHMTVQVTEPVDALLHAKNVPLPANNEDKIVSMQANNVSTAVNNESLTDKHVDESTLRTPNQNRLTAVRRSARITNRQGPLETTERYTLAAEIKSLEKPPAPKRLSTSTEALGLVAVMLDKESWQEVAEGSGFIISPGKKESVCAFIKGAGGSST